MITSRIRTYDFFPQLTAEIEARSVAALDEAARVGADVATAAARTASGKQVSTFTVVAAHPSGEGFASGIRANNPLFRIFDHGSLSKRNRDLKKDRRKESWTVKRRGTEYTAHRRSTEGGIDASNISNPARLAGRKTLLAALLRHT